MKKQSKSDSKEASFLRKKWRRGQQRRQDMKMLSVRLSPHAWKKMEAAIRAESKLLAVPLSRDEYFEVLFR